MESVYRSWERLAWIRQHGASCAGGLPVLVAYRIRWLCGFPGCGCDLWRAPANLDQHCNSFALDDATADWNANSNPDFDLYTDSDAYFNTHEYTHLHTDGHTFTYTDTLAATNHWSGCL